MTPEEQAAADAKAAEEAAAAANAEADKRANETDAEREQREADEAAQTDYRGKLNATNRFLEKEGYEFKDGKWVKPPAAAAKPSNDLTAADALALAKAPIQEEDYERVLKWAKANNQTVAEALKDADLTVILERRAEERRTALATNTGGARGGTKVSGEDLLKKAETTGEVPDTEEGMQALFRARQTRHKRK